MSLTLSYKECFDDDIARQNSLSYDDIIHQITLPQVKQFLLSLGVREIDEHSDYLICPTICHNPIDRAESMKLYYYDETKNFHCYTQCSENFSILTLYCKYMKINHYEVSYQEAADYVRQFVFGGPQIEYKAPEKEEKVERVDFITLPEYNKHVLDVFDHYYHPLWLGDGITPESMDKFNIKFSISQNKIVIPHYDIDGRLVGIRARSINEEDLAYGKYMPIRVENTLYAHKLGFNLYGIHEHKEAIQFFKRATIYESEKSVMLDDGFYGRNSVAVATCGSQLNRFQINLLTRKLGVNEITLAYDKEYTDLYDAKGWKYRQKLAEKCNRYRGLAAFYCIVDDQGLLEEKDAPCDKGKETLEKLMTRKFMVK